MENLLQLWRTSGPATQLPSLLRCALYHRPISSPVAGCSLRAKRETAAQPRHMLLAGQLPNTCDVQAAEHVMQLRLAADLAVQCSQSPSCAPVWMNGSPPTL
jgi:hypothetical protein